MRFALVSIIFLIITIPTFSQVELKLQEAIEQMEKNNSQLKVQQFYTDMASTELSGTISGFLPKISIGYSGNFTNDPLHSFGFKLQQKIVTQADFNPAVLNDPKTMSHFNTKMLIQQPIFNYDVYSARNALKEKLKASGFQQKYAVSLLTVEIKNSYTTLQYLYQARKAVREGIIAYREVLRNTQNLQTQGYAKPTDVLMVKVNLLETQNKEVEIENNISNLSDYLSWLMGTETKNIFRPAEELSKSPYEFTSQPFSDSRADIQAIKSGIAAQQYLLSVTKRRAYPRLNAFGEYNFSDKKLFGFGSNAFMVGVSLTWNIFNGTETAHAIRLTKFGIQKAEAELTVYIEKSNLQLQKAKREASSNLLKIDFAEAAKNEAGESLRILRNRFEQGLEKVSDLLIAQASQLENEVKYFEAIKDYNLTLIQIELLTQ